nr:MAG TPA: hypothetical protein [Caudoviricetes sp.]
MFQVYLKGGLFYYDILLTYICFFANIIIIIN